MLCAIWYHLYNSKNLRNTDGGVFDLVPFIQFKNLRNTDGGVLLLVNCMLQPATLLEVTLLHECFSRVLNSTKCTKSCKASQILVQY